MRIAQAVKEAATNVMRSKLRTALTMLGLVVGISSVIALVGLGQGSNNQVDEQMKALGGDILTTYLFKDSLEYEDIEHLKSLEDLKAVAPSKMIGGKVSYQKQTSSRAMIEASDEDYLAARDLAIASGRNLSSVDRNNRSKVCILGPSVARDLFGTVDAVGKTVKIDGKEFTVVGVLEEQGETMGMSSSGLLIIPITVVPDLGGDTEIKEFYSRAQSYDEVTLAKALIMSYLQLDKAFAPDSFNVGSLDDMLNAEESVNETMTLLLVGISSISLIVAGIGVMNVMLVSVTERIREIGIKKALGARRSDILVQFLVEALIISSAGGVVGVAVGLLFGACAQGAGVYFAVSGTVIGGAVGASVLVGLVFGIFPAYRASRLNPLEALRHE